MSQRASAYTTALAASDNGDRDHDDGSDAFHTSRFKISDGGDACARVGRAVRATTFRVSEEEDRASVCDVKGCGMTSSDVARWGVSCEEDPPRHNSEKSRAWPGPPAAPPAAARPAAAAGRVAAESVGAPVEQGS